MGKYAMLLSGGVDKEHNYPRYKNDLEWVCKVLLDDCDYEKENIQIFYADGQNLTLKDAIIPTKKATKDEIIYYMEQLSLQLSEQDRLLLVVSNHGGNINGGCIYLWGETFIELTLFAELLNRIAAEKIILLGECYGGNILDKKISNACVITANVKDTYSYTNPDDMTYDELIKHFFSYIHTEYPNGDAIPKGQNNVMKAFIYARENDVLCPGSPLSEELGITEIPQIQCDLCGEVRL